MTLSANCERLFVDSFPMSVSVFQYVTQKGAHVVEPVEAYM